MNEYRPEEVTREVFNKELQRMQSLLMACQLEPMFIKKYNDSRNMPLGAVWGYFWDGRFIHLFRQYRPFTEESCYYVFPDNINCYEIRLGGRYE